MRTNTNNWSYLLKFLRLSVLVTVIIASTESTIAYCIVPLLRTDQTPLDNSSCNKDFNKQYFLEWFKKRMDQYFALGRAGWDG